jgi:uncharacterized protein
MRLRRLIDDLAGRSHHRVVDLLRAQIDAAIEGVDLARDLTAGAVGPIEARSRIAGIEHAGDACRADLVGELATALTTPIDREDLYRLSRSVDDVLDNVRDFVREVDLYGVAPAPSSGPLLDAVGDGIRALRVAVDLVVDRPADVTLASLTAHKQSGRVRQLYQTAIAALLDEDALSTTVLKQRELLRRLDVVGLRLAECADALSDAMLKRSH